MRSRSGVLAGCSSALGEGPRADEGVPAPARVRSGDAVFEGVESVPEVVERYRSAAAVYFTTVIRSAFGGVRGLSVVEWAVR